MNLEVRYLRGRDDKDASLETMDEVVQKAKRLVVEVASANECGWHGVAHQPDLSMFGEFCRSCFSV